jgi:hypothetical protein
MHLLVLLIMTIYRIAYVDSDDASETRPTLKKRLSNSGLLGSLAWPSFSNRPFGSS